MGMKKTAVVLTLLVGTAITMSADSVPVSVAFGEPVVDCPEGNVTVPYTITTGSNSAATVVERLTKANGGDLVSEDSYTILAGTWTGSRTKLWEGVFEHTGLADGSYSLEVCAEQAGSGGNPAKSDCTTVPIVVACAEQWTNPCASTAAFGEVTGNDHIRPNATAQIQFRGNFGETAWVVIDGPDYFHREGAIVRNGDSCNYHANWKFTTTSGADFHGNNGPGVYTVKVTGNGVSLEFPVTLVE